MRVGRGAAATLIAATMAAAMTGMRRSPAGGLQAEARRLLRAASDSQLALNYSAAYSLAKQSLRADPAYLPAAALLYERYMTNESPTSAIEFFDSVATHVADRELGRCYHELARYARGYALSDSTRTARSPGARDCQDFLVGATTVHPAPQQLVRAAERLARRYPDEPRPAYDLYTALFVERSWEEMGRWGREWSSPAHQPALRALGFAARELGVVNADSVLAAATRDWTRPEFSAPGFRAAYREIFSADGLLTRDPDHPPSVAFAARVSAITEAAIGDLRAISASGDPLMRVLEGTRLALWFLDRGRLQEAMTAWAPVISLADSMGDPGRRAYLHMRRGRTLVKLARNDEAERELLLARGLAADCDRPDISKEIEHNLFHLYDAQRRDDSALAAGNAYVRTAAVRGLSAVRMGSKYDLGMFFRARGDFERSRQYFEPMLADIDSLGTEWYFGGEYYELTGELDQARTYYRRSLRSDGFETRAQAGLVRLALATGDDSAAILYARLHDVGESTRGIPESAPLLPRVLRSLGRPAEARAELDAARATALRHGQVAAWASLTVEIAAITLATNGALATALADSAADAAGRVAATDVRFRARALAAVARARDPARHEASLRTLDELTRASDRMSDPQLRAELRREYGSVLAANGRWREALGQFSLAAAATDSIARRIALDPTQAGYRSVQRSVYDAAMTTIARHARGAEGARLFEEWSARRKSRAYEEASRPAAASGPVSPGSAIVDIGVLNDVVAIAVRTSRENRVVILPIAPDSLRGLIHRFVSQTDARVGSLIDESHASFPIATAHELYLALLAPVATAIDSARSITIIPDGATWLVPFDALVVTPPATSSTRPFIEARFVIDRHRIALATSPRAASVATPVPNARVAALAPAVDTANDVGALQELRAIAGAIPAGRVALYRGRQATESMVREMSPVGVIHFATHAMANAQDPAMSWLALSPGGSDDGRLHAFEIERLRLRGALVVLDACETASGRALEGEGVLSLSRSFLKAGASGTIATLWPVGASAGPMMAAFYAALGQGSDALTALRSAKLARRSAGASPLEWGAYIYVTR